MEALKGTVASGLGRAHVFMSQEHYQNQFKKILGSSAWPGTLNIEVSSNHLSSWNSYRVASGLGDGPQDEQIVSRFIRINGFERQGRSFGGANALHASLSHKKSSLDVVILIPDLTRHVNVIEIISTVFLREKLSLSDGDNVLVKIKSN